MCGNWWFLQRWDLLLIWLCSVYLSCLQPMNPHVLKPFHAIICCLSSGKYICKNNQGFIFLSIQVFKFTAKQLMASGQCRSQNWRSYIYFSFNDALMCSCPEWTWISTKDDFLSLCQNKKVSTSVLYTPSLADSRGAATYPIERIKRMTFMQSVKWNNQTKNAC